MISENAYLVPKDFKEKYGLKNRYLLVATDLEKEINKIQKDPLMIKVQALDQEIKDQTKSITTKI